MNTLELSGIDKTCHCFLATFPRGTITAITINYMSHFHSSRVNAVMPRENGEHKLKITMLHLLHKQEIYFYCYYSASSVYFSMLWKITRKQLCILWIHNMQKCSIAWWFVNDLKSKSSCICYGLNLFPVQIFLNWFIFFKLVHIFQTSFKLYFSNWFIFFKLGWNF